MFTMLLAIEEVGANEELVNSSTMKLSCLTRKQAKLPNLRKRMKGH